MQDNSDSRNPHSADDLPAELRQAMQELFRSTNSIDSQVDHSILSQARQHLEQASIEVGVQRSTHWVGKRFSVAAAIAATVLVAFGLSIFRVNRDVQPTVTLPAVAREDLDGNGKVDVLDAFMLARHLQRAKPTNVAWDLNQDGKVDQSDIQHVAALAVKLHQVETKG